MNMLLVIAGVVEGLYVGLGRGDATGPPSGYVMMGMANLEQVGRGVHTRLYARAFVFVDDDGRRFAFVNLDGCMVGHILKKRSLEAVGLAEYNASNVLISGTHSHSGPSGFLQHTFFHLAGSGWVPAVLDAMANGIATALLAAHADVEARMASGRKSEVKVGESMLYNASISRSPSAYLENPAEERALYEDDSDKQFVTLGVYENGTARGALTWFAVHGTSMNNTNHFVSGDNKGYASLMLEREMDVAAFASSNLGDVSPNLLGAHCRNTGLACDFYESTCPADVPIRGEVQRNEQCSSIGPGVDMFDSTRIIGERQKDFAKAMLETLDTALDGVQVRHTFVEMPGRRVNDWATGDALGELCDAAFGDGFAAGTIDGPGALDFKQNGTASPLWKVATSFLGKITKETRECQRPKTILLPTGTMKVPHPWSPSILPAQLAKIGSLVIAGVPTELTTMAGRRLKAMLRTKFGQNVTVAVAGLSNEYADYTATKEEYGAQRYEGSSTIFGPYQLDAFLEIFAGLADDMLQDRATDPGPEPEDFSKDLSMRVWNKLAKLRAETPPDGASFGDVLSESWANITSLAPGDVAIASFVGADMNNDLKTDATYLEVQRGDGSSWTTLFTDADPETRINNTEIDKKYRQVDVRFDIPDTAQPGTYRLVYHGDARVHVFIVAGGKPKLKSFTGISSNFSVVTP